MLQLLTGGVLLNISAPQPMVKPGFYGVEKGEEIQVILPQASEEYGPISHYYLIVVPDEEMNNHKSPDQFLTEDVRRISFLSVDATELNELKVKIMSRSCCSFSRTKDKNLKVKTRLT